MGSPPAKRISIADWIEKPQIMHSTPWVPAADNKGYNPRNVPESYDGIYFIERIRPTRATPNGEIAARDRLRF